MRALVQRVRWAKVIVANETVGEIGPGLLVLLGITHADTEANSTWLADKLVGLRIFNDAADKMNLGVLDIQGSLLIVSQFTLYGDCQKGRRPSFVSAARPEIAEPLYEHFIRSVKSLGVPVATGRFGALMHVELCNDGPVTLMVESPLA